MNTFRRTAAVATLAVTAVAGTGLTATAATTASAAGTAACTARVGSITPAGQHGHHTITATKPPTVKSRTVAQPIFKAGAVRIASNGIDARRSGTGGLESGFVVIGDALSRFYYEVDDSGQIDYQPTLTRIGGGWSNYVAIAESVWFNAVAGSSSRAHFYGLRGDGVLTRWTISGGKFSAPASYKLGADVKAMALISKTKTYDTFVVNTKAGSLKTVRIPTSAPLKPVIKTVRARSWQGFEALVASKCGNYGTVLTAIDQDTKTAHVYAVSRFNGTSTVIQSQGQAPGSFSAPVYFRWGTASDMDPLNGE